MPINMFTTLNGPSAVHTTASGVNAQIRDGGTIID